MLMVLAISKNFRILFLSKGKSEKEKLQGSEKYFTITVRVPCDRIHNNSVFFVVFNVRVSNKYLVFNTYYEYYGNVWLQRN